jgi:hypothetical protein
MVLWLCCCAIAADETGNSAERFFVRKTWRISSGTAFAFETKGKGTRTFGKESKPFVWILKPDGIVETTGERTGGSTVQTLYFRFESARKGFFGESVATVDAPMERIK